MNLTLRVGTDLGWRPGEPEALDGTTRNTIQLLVGNVRWRTLNRHLTLTAGRMLKMDIFDLRYVDGLQAGVVLGPVRLAAFGGEMVKAGTFLGSPTFEPDGVRSSDAALAARVGPSWPYPISGQQSAPALMYGAQLGTVPLGGFVATLGYQKAVSAGQVDLERAAAGLSFERWCVDLQANAEYDLFASQLSYLDGRLGCRLPAHLYAGVEYLRMVPTFDASSIWASFAFGPLEEGSVVGRWQPSDTFSIVGRARVRRYTDPKVGGSSLAEGGELSSQWAPAPRQRYGLSLSYLSGYGGTQAWVSGDARRPITQDLSASLSLAAGYAHDPLLPNLDTAVLGARLGFHYEFDEHATMNLYFEDDTSRVIVSDLRAYLVLDLGLGL